MLASEQSSKRRGIISAGTWTLDRIKLLDAWPQEEHLAQIIATDMQGGGSGHNLAVDITRLDPTLPVQAIGLVGQDTDGEFLISRAMEAGIDTSQLHKNEYERTSYTDVMSDHKTGKRTFFHYSGTSDLLSPDHFDFTRCRGRLLHLGLLGLHNVMDSPWKQFQNGWVAVLAAAQENGIYTNLELVSIDSQKIRDVALPCIHHLDSLIINEYELSALSGLSVCGDNGMACTELCITAAESLMSKGSMRIVVVHFPQAAIAVTASGETFTKPSFTVHPSWIKSTVGAGDAFAAGMLYGVHENWTIDASLELAHATAAASLRSATTVGSVDSVAACLEFAHRAARHEKQNDDSGL